MTKEKCLDRYLYTKIHEIFFCSFLVELYEWIAKLGDDQGRQRFDILIIRTPELVWILGASKDKSMHVVDHWLNCIIGDFVTEFAVDTLVSYNESERRFFKGP